MLKTKTSVLQIACLLICALSARPAPAESSRVEFLKRILLDNATHFNDWEPTKIEALVTDVEYPRLSEDEILGLIQEERGSIQSEFANAADLHERLAVVEHNIRFKHGNHVTNTERVIVWMSGAKWRVDREILKRENSVEIPESLRDNRYARYFPLENNRYRIEAFNGLSQRSTISESEDPAFRSLDIGSTTAPFYHVEMLKRFGRLALGSAEGLLDGDITILSDQADEVQLLIVGELDRVTLSLAPQYDYALLFYSREVPYKGMSIQSDIAYSEYRQFGESWFPMRRTMRRDMLIGEVSRPLEEEEWEVLAADFETTIESEEALFEPKLTGDFAFADRTVSPPIQLRTGSVPLASSVLEAVHLTVTDMEQATAQENGGGGHSQAHAEHASVDEGSGKREHPSHGVLRNRKVWLLAALGLTLLLVGLGLLHRQKGSASNL